MSRTFCVALFCLGVSLNAVAGEASSSPEPVIAAVATPTEATRAPEAVVADAQPEVVPLLDVRPDPRGAAASTRALSYVDWTARPHAPTDVLPTVIVLHGWGGTPERILPIAQFADLDVRVVAPQAPLPSRRGYTWIAHLREDGTPKSATAEADASMADLVALVERLRVERPMAGKPILVGFSLGGSMAYGLSVYHPELFEEVVILSGPMPPRIIPERANQDQAALPIRAGHIEADPVVPAGPSEAAILKLASVGFDATWQTFPGTQHRVSEDERAWLRDLLVERWPAARQP